MKRKYKIILSGVPLLAVLALFIYALFSGGSLPPCSNNLKPIEVPAEMRTCTNDSECTYILKLPYDCSAEGINKKYEQEASVFLNKAYTAHKGCPRGYSCTMPQNSDGTTLGVSCVNSSCKANYE